MKRKNIPRTLTEASLVGWVAEFPDDIWTTIFSYLPAAENGRPNLGLLLRLMATSKRMCLLIKPCVLVLLENFLNFCAYGLATRGCPDTYKCHGIYATFVYAIMFVQRTPPRVDLRQYIKDCPIDETNHTAQHLSNCVSLLNLAYLEGRYLYVHHKQDEDYTGSCHGYHRYQSIIGDDEGKELSCQGALGTTLMYYNPVSKKVTPLWRMQYNVLGCNPSFAYLYNQLEESLKCFHEEHKIASFRKLYPCDGRTKRIAAMKLLREMCTVDVSDITQRTEFKYLIVRINQKPYYIYEQGANDFRKHCFLQANGSVQCATKAAILDSFHKRNYSIVTETDRFKLPSSPP